MSQKNCGHLVDDADDNTDISKSSLIQKYNELYDKYNEFLVYLINNHDEMTEFFKEYGVDLSNNKYLISNQEKIDYFKLCSKKYSLNSILNSEISTISPNKIKIVNPNEYSVFNPLHDTILNIDLINNDDDKYTDSISEISNNSIYYSSEYEKMGNEYNISLSRDLIQEVENSSSLYSNDEKIKTPCFSDSYLSPLMNIITNKQNSGTESLLFTSQEINQSSFNQNGVLIRSKSSQQLKKTFESKIRPPSASVLRNSRRNIRERDSESTIFILNSEKLKKYLNCQNLNPRKKVIIFEKSDTSTNLRKTHLEISNIEIVKSINSNCDYDSSFDYSYCM